MPLEPFSKIVLFFSGWAESQARSSSIVVKRLARDFTVENSLPIRYTPSQFFVSFSHRLPHNPLDPLKQPMEFLQALFRRRHHIFAEIDWRTIVRAQ